MVSIPNSKFPNAFRSPGGLITARGNSHLRVCPLWISLQVMHYLSDISNLEKHEEYNNANLPNLQ